MEYVQSGGGLQRPAGAALAQVEVLARQLDDRLVEVDRVCQDAAWMAEGGAIQAILWPHRGSRSVRAVAGHLCRRQDDESEHAELRSRRKAGTVPLPRPRASTARGGGSRKATVCMSAMPEKAAWSQIGE